MYVYNIYTCIYISYKHTRRSLAQLYHTKALGTPSERKPMIIEDNLLKSVSEKTLDLCTELLHRFHTRK